MLEPIDQREALWDSFLQRWPLEQLPSMTLPAYNQAGSDDSFCRWLEKHLESLGSIWGGSSLKFGIYSRANSEKDPSGQNGVTANERYAWYTRYGQSEEQAFARVRDLIVSVAQAAREGRPDDIEAIDLWPIVKWKIAFLYQNRQQPTVLPIYLRKYLVAAMEAPAPKLHSELYRALLALRGSELLLSFADRMYDKGQLALQHEQRVAVLRHFFACKDLTKRLEAAQATLAFCDLALALHEQGLDWWITEAGAIHAGRTEDFRVLRVGVVLRVDVGANVTRVTLHGSDEAQWQPLEEALVDSLVEDVSRSAAALPATTRAGYWPDDYDNMADRLVITLTDGALRNGYLSIPKLQRLFPDECFAESDQPAEQLFTLRLPDGTSLQTQVLKQYKRIQARFNALFAKEQLQAGDQAVLTHVADLDYQLSFRRVGQQDEPATARAENVSSEALMNIVPLNQILFGPPGTGKTYATVEAALEVLDPDYLREPLRSRSELKQRFDELVQQDRIRFVTFHQSFSYEDFVEGLRATTDDASGQLRYEVVDGVFKSLCDAAAVKVTQQAAAPNELDQRRVWKMSLGNTLGEDASIYQECVAGGYVLLGYGGSVDFAGCTNRQQVQARFADAGVVPENPATDYGITSVTAFVAKMRVGDLIVVSDGNFKFRAIGEVMGDYQFKPHAEFEDGYAQLRPVKWLRQYQPSLPHTELLNAQFSQMTLYELRSPTLNKDKLQALLAAGTEAVSTAPDSRVLIIDEINRGNISRIFGELITLIEPSKRAGADEALSVVLPYSKERFSVPDNVYLIGTMNTADRSLAGLDIALRRRFVFREMPPKPELLDSVEVQGLNIGQLLRVMNQRIEVLFDREHCLGHAYFMPLKEDASLARLEGILRNEILPLLQEYFFDDWQRIQWVLNDHRKPVIDRFVQQDTQDLAGLFGDISVPAQGGVWRINDAAFKRISAYRGVIGVQSSAEIPAEIEETGA